MSKKTKPDGASETAERPSTELDVDEFLYGSEGAPRWYEISPPTPDELQDYLLRIFKEVRPAKGDRVAYIHALRIISVLLMSPDLISRECGSWLFRLAEALEDLDAGIVWPFLQPARISHRKPSASYLHYRRACVAAGVKALIRSGVARMDAARQAIRKVKSIAGTSPKTILSWMDEFGKKRAADGPGATAWTMIGDDLAKCRTPAEFKHAAEWCFWNANRPIVH
jgi:hypothetical protein